MAQSTARRGRSDALRLRSSAAAPGNLFSIAGSSAGVGTAAVMETLQFNAQKVPQAVDARQTVLSASLVASHQPYRTSAPK